MASIYKITNLINNKIYIGETIQPINHRWNQHISSSLNKNRYDYNYPIHNAIRKYGDNNFIIELIEECDDNIRFERESYYIEFYDSTNQINGYNLIKEGQGGCKYSSKEIKELWNMGLTISEIKQKLNCSKGLVQRRLRGQNIPENEIKNRMSLEASIKQGEKIEQYTLSGKFVKEWHSISYCEKETGFNQSAISQVCHQRQLSAYGFLWKFVKDNTDISVWVNNYNNKKHAGRPKKKIGQYDKTTQNLISIYESATEAAKALGIPDKSGICRAARKQGSSAGFIWKYIEQE